MFERFYSRNKDLLLKIASFLLVVLFFVAIEVVVRIVYPAKAVDHMIDLGPINLFSKQEIQGETWYGITNKNAYSDRNVLFKEKKDPGTIRIICLGGSASAGWPHPPDEIYSLYLQRNLEVMYPGRKIEVINCSAHGFASYRIRQVFETIIPLDPDAVIIWCGNNEFLEGRNYRTSDLKNAIIRFRNNFRSLQLVRQLFVKHRYDDTPDVTETFWRKVNEQALELRSDPEQFEKVREHYQKSMEGILQTGRETGIKILLMTVPVNLREWEPNVSWLGLTGIDSLKWLAEFKNGKRQLLRRENDDAVKSFLRAHEIAPLHAETMFMLARSFEASKDSVSALQYYVKAKDFDYNPFRSISDFNNILRRISLNQSHVSLLDMEKQMNLYAATGIPGFDLFLDYVHPTREGNIAIARELSNKISAENILGITPARRSLTLDEVSRINASEYRDDEDMFLQFTRFSLCCMTHQYYAALRFGKQLRETLPPETLNNDPSGRMTILFDAIDTFQAYADMEQRNAQQELPALEEKEVMDKIRAFYAKHFPYGAF